MGFLSCVILGPGASLLKQGGVAPGGAWGVGYAARGGDGAGHPCLGKILGFMPILMGYRLDSRALPVGA